MEMTSQNEVLPSAQQAAGTVVDSVVRFRRGDEETSSEPHAHLPETPAIRRLPRKRVILTSLSLLIVIGAGIAAWQWFQYLSAHEETDDAYITGHLHQVSSRIDGTVEKVLVDDNQHVNQGTLLVTLDPKDFRAKVDQALANLKQAERQIRVDQSSVSFQNTDAQGQEANAEGSIANALANITKAEAIVREAKANILATQSDLRAKQAEVDRADADWKRYESLATEGAVTLSQRDSAKRDYLVAVENCSATREAVQQATERLQQAEQIVAASKAQLGQAQGEKQRAKASAVKVKVDQAQLDANLAAIEKAKAALDEAQFNLSYTRIVAPVSGRIGKKTVEEGHRVQPGEPLLTIVSDEPWVVANFKETQLKRMQVGQKVEIKIDALPEHQFEGRILSFSPASGASFAVLPSDNATGNFTKIVQRLPVKIAFNSQSMKGYEDRLAPGLSVTASVDLHSKPTLQDLLAERK